MKKFLLFSFIVFSLIFSACQYEEDEEDTSFEFKQDVYYFVKGSKGILSLNNPSKKNYELRISPDRMEFDKVIKLHNMDESNYDELIPDIVGVLNSQGEFQALNTGTCYVRAYYKVSKNKFEYVECRVIVCGVIVKMYDYLMTAAATGDGSWYRIIEQNNHALELREGKIINVSSYLYPLNNNFGTVQYIISESDKQYIEILEAPDEFGNPSVFLKMKKATTENKPVTLRIIPKDVSNEFALLNTFSVLRFKILN